jgi:hypothetical protein
MPRTKKKTWYKNMALWALVVAALMLCVTLLTFEVSYRQYKLSRTQYEEITKANTLDSEIHSRLDVLNSEIERVEKYVSSFSDSIETKTNYTLTLNKAELLRSEAETAWINKNYEESYNLLIEANDTLYNIIRPSPPSPPVTNWYLIGAGLVLGVILVVLTGWLIIKRKETSEE